MKKALLKLIFGLSVALLCVVALPGKSSAYTPVLYDYVLPQSFSGYSIAYPSWSAPTGYSGAYSSYFGWLYLRCQVIGFATISGQYCAYIEIAQAGNPAYTLYWPVSYTDGFGNTVDFLVKTT